MFNNKFALVAISAAFVATMTVAVPLSPRSGSPPSGSLHGLAQWSDFDGTSACGTQLPADQALVGVEGSLFDSIDEPCGRTITIEAPNGVSRQATIQESCGDGCGENGLLLTTSLFSDFYSLDKGNFEATWSF